MLRPILLLLLLLSLSSCSMLSVPATHPVPAEIFTDTEWSGTIFIDGDVTIHEGASVRIVPGSKIIFLPPSPGRDLLQEHPNFIGSELIVHGTLLALGTSSEPILFAAIDPAAPAGSWGGVNLSHSKESAFRFCLFTQADSAIHSQESSVSVRCSSFRHNLVGVRFFSSEIEISDNHFCENGTAIRFHLGSPKILGNLLERNDRGFFITSFPEEYEIRHNDIIESRTAQVVLGEEVPDDVLMQENYWGSLDPQEIRRHFVDRQRIDYLGRVLFEPFLLTPFKPQEGSCSP